jgi:PQQ-like domain
VVAGVAISNGSEIYAIDDNGNTLWSHDLDHQLSSITISSNGMYIAAGGWQTEPGPAGIYDNGEVYLFSSGGKLLWSVNAGSSNPVFKVAISSDGSVVAADGESSVMYLDTAAQEVLWSESTDGYPGMAMSADGSLLVMPRQSGSITAFNAQGAPLWSSPIVGSDDNMAISSDGSHVWIGEAQSGYNGTFSLFTAQGSLVWQREIYSPAISIQTGGNLTAFVSTNWGGLLYGGDGSLLANVTSSANPGSAGQCNPLPSFWYWGTEEEPVAFLDTQGQVVSSYDPGGFTDNAALSSDGRYAAVASNKGSSSTSSLAFVYLGQPNPSCALPTSGTREVTFQQIGACSPTFWGVPWSVTIGNVTKAQPPGAKLPLGNYSLSGTSNSSLSEITFSLANGTYDYTVSPSAEFFTPTSGTINVSGSNITVDITYTGTSCITTTQTASSGNKGG